MLLSIFSIFVFLITFTSIIYYIRLLMLKLKFKGVWMPFHLPFIGIAYAFFKNPNSLKLSKFGKGSTTVMKIGWRNAYLTSDPDEIRIILNDPKCLNKNDYYTVVEDLIKNSLLIVPAEIWKPRRKLIAKSFYPTLLNSYLPIFQKEGKNLLENLKKNNNLNIFNVLQKYTFDNFCIAILGQPKERMKEKIDTILEMFSRLNDIKTKRILNPFLQINFLFWVFGEGRDLLQIVEDLRNAVTKIIQNKKEERFLSGNEDKSQSSLDVMIELMRNKDIDENTLIEEIFLLILASTDSSATTLAFACALLALHEDVQEKVYQEVVEMVGLDQEVTSNHLLELKYMEMVLNETMRIFPASVVIGRKPSGSIDIGSRVLDETINIFISVMKLHRNKDIYPNPLKFDPDRFLPEEVAKRHPCSFIPFSAGPRNCIGIRYSFYLMKTALAVIVRNFKIETDLKSIDEIELADSVVTRSDNLKCRFIPRNTD